jgi:hypothetical protein
MAQMGSQQDDAMSSERKTDTNLSSPQKRGRGRPPKSENTKRTRNQAKAEELDVIPKCHVFFPTEDEFQDFMGYLTKCEQQVKSDGIFKVSGARILLC